MSLGKRLTQLRKAKGLSQEQLAEKLDLTRQTISKWELNQSTPDLDYLVRLSDYFEVTTDYLIKGERETDATNNSSQNEENTATPQRTAPFKRCFCLGTSTAIISLLGIIAFVICAALNPITVLLNGMQLYGLLAFLISRRVLGFFLLLAALCALGTFFSVYGIVKSKEHKKNK